MISKITQNKNRSALTELIDSLFIPSSIIRFAYYGKKEGEFPLKPEFKNSKVAQTISKILPYPQAVCLEALRLYGYYEIGKHILQKLI